MDMPDRQRPLQDRPGALRQGHHLRARSRTTGARDLPVRARHVQLRPHHGQDLQGQHGAPRGAQGRRVRLDARSIRPATGRGASTGKRFDTGELVKQRFEHQQPARLPELRAQHAASRKLPGPARARGARPGAGLRVDEPPAVLRRLPARDGTCSATPTAHADGLPSPEELALLEPLRGKLPAEVFGPMYAAAHAPRAAGHSLRDNLRQARRPCSKEAGWTYRDGALRNAKGEAFVLEYLDSTEGGVRDRVAAGCATCEKLGIAAAASRSVDFALYQQRLDKFEFDMTTHQLPRHAQPGPANWPTSSAARRPTTESSRQLHGASTSPAVDALVAARGRRADQGRNCCRPAGRSTGCIMHGHYLIPQWTLTPHRIAYNAAGRAGLKVRCRRTAERRRLGHDAPGGPIAARTEARQRHGWPTSSSACC